MPRLEYDFKLFLLITTNVGAFVTPEPRAPELTVYIPSFGRFAQCLNQVSRLNDIRLINEVTMRIVVSVNGDDTYDEHSLKGAGADVVAWRKTNLGGNANICLGYEWIEDSEYLWILSDDDDVVPSRFAALLSLMRQKCDLIIGSRSAREKKRLYGDVELELRRVGAAIDLVSACVYRSAILQGLVPLAFERIVTWYPHSGVIAEAVRRSRADAVAIVPLSYLVDDSASVEAVAKSRARAGRDLGFQFFGGALTQTFIGPHGFNSRAFNRWWGTHWHRASMYRMAGSEQQAWVDRMARSSPITFTWWLLSLPPYWRLKDSLRPHESSRGSDHFRRFKRALSRHQGGRDAR